MNRAASILVLFGLAPLLMGGGMGQGSPPTAGKQDVTATIAIDPHASGVTPTALSGSITIAYKKQIVGGVFTVPSAQFNLGCDTSLSDGRFVGTLLTNFMPDDQVAAMFAAIGITVAPPSNIPFIKEILTQSCVPDSFLGHLTMEVVIGLSQ